jgi:guanylate kinase
MKSELATKTLVMIVGPSAIGKSTIMEEVVRLNPDFSYVRSFTTRKKRPGEKSHYKFMDRDTVIDIHQKRQTVTYFEHPTTHDIYGTTVESYPSSYNLLDTLSGAVQGYRDLPFKRTVTISLTAPSDEWQKWFLSRYPESSDEATKRLDEAALSINWSLQDADSYWITNSTGNIRKVAQELIDIVLHQPPITQSSHPHAMLELIERGVWRNE